MAHFDGTGYPIQSNDTLYATDSLSGWLSQVAGFPQPELPSLEPLSEAQEYTMLHQLLAHEQPCQTMENAEYLPPYDQQLQVQPNHLVSPIPTVNYGAASSSKHSGPLPQRGMIDYTATRLHSLHHPSQESAQKPLTDHLNPDIHHQMLGSATFQVALQSSEQCAITRPPSHSCTITAAVPASAEGTHAESGTARRITGSGRGRGRGRGQGRGRGRGRGRGQGRGRGNLLPQQEVATGGRHQQTAPSPTTDEQQMGPVCARRNRAEELLRSLRQYHILTERQRRNRTNRMFAIIRTLVPAFSLPDTAARPRSDKVTVLTEMINFILHCQNEQKLLEAQLTQQRRLARRNVLTPNSDTHMCMCRLTCVDHTGDAAAVTAVTTLPPVGSVSCLASFLGTNVAIHVYGQSCCLTISSPHSRSVGLLDRVIATLEVHYVQAICVTVIVRDATQVCTLQCQAHRDVELLQNDLHTTMQTVVNDVVSSPSSELRDHA